MTSATFCSTSSMLRYAGHDDAATVVDMRFLLIRHGQTPNNLIGRLDSDAPGAALTDLGHHQARAVPEALRREKIAGIYASRLIRAQQTAAPLATVRGLTPQITEGLQEISAGDYDLRQDQDAVEAYHHAHDLWVSGDLDHTIPGGENGRTFVTRYAGALRSIARPHQDSETVAVVSHGAAIRVFTAIATGLSLSLQELGPLRNTGMVVLSGHPDRGWELENWLADPLGGAHVLGDVTHDVTADENAEASTLGVRSRASLRE